MKFVKENFISLLVLVLVAILFLQRCTEKNTPGSDRVTTVIKDSIIIVRDTTFFSDPILVESKRDTIRERDSIFLPSADYEELKKQFIKLREELLAQNIYKSKEKFDSSSITINDTIQGNKIIGRSIGWDIKYPRVTINNYIPIKPKNQFYIGGQLLGNPSQLIQQINGNILLKNKKDQIFGGGVGINTNGTLIYNVQTYWKIKL